MNSKTILITGASRGIGKACAITLAQDGVTLALCASRIDELLKVADVCREKGARVKCFAFDLSNIDALKEQVMQIQDICGPIHTLINNAGLWLPKSFLESDIEAWDQGLDVNLKSVFHLTYHVLKAMPHDGAVVFISSIAAKKTYPGNTMYAATKFGLAGFAGSLFEDIHELGIKVCSIFPGLVDTDMHVGDESLDPDKMLKPQDIADAVNYVLSTPPHVCPTELVLMPQKHPRRERD